MGRRKLKTWHIAVASLGVLVLAFGVFRVAMRAQLRSRIDAVRAAGYPVSLTELDGWYEIPPLAPNAADYITTAFTYMKIPRCKAIPLLGTATLPPRAQPLDSNTISLVDKLLTDNAKALELLLCRGTVIGYTPLQSGHRPSAGHKTFVVADRRKQCVGSGPAYARGRYKEAARQLRVNGNHARPGG
jgi:hypothetical protein